MPFRFARLSVALSLCAVLTAGALAGDNQCDPGESPDIIVGDLYNKANYGTVNGTTGYSIGTESCNIGTCWANWLAGTPNHPVIAQNMYRLENSRFEQIGVGWLKHGFATLDDDLCGTCNDADGSHLGVNCSDPYGAGLNGQQSSLGPRFEVNPETGTHLHPYSFQGQTGNAIYKRMSVRVDDLDPGQHPGATYWIEGQYVTADDAAAGNAKNNNSYRQAFPNSGGTDFQLNGSFPTQVEQPALFAWQKFGDGHVAWIEGKYVGGYQVTDLGNGIWHYEYALQNVLSDRAAGAVTIPLPHGVQLTNVGFADADYHSGEPFDDTDWTWAHNTGPGPNSITFSTESFAANEDANALRWGTVYNFRFDADVAPDPVNQQAVIDLFKPGSPTFRTWNVAAPDLCGDFFCEGSENETNCAVDCSGTGEIPAGEVPGMMTVSLADNGNVILDWDASCSSSDGDYSIYEGMLYSGAVFTTHTAKLCGTAGATRAQITPDPASTYYLVVPSNTLNEGGYGSDSGGTPRSVGMNSCFPQSTGACE